MKQRSSPQLLTAENLNLTYTKVYGNGYGNVLDHVSKSLTLNEASHR